LFAAHGKYDASYEYADCDHNWEGVPTGRICKFG